MTFKEAFNTWLKSRGPLVALLYDADLADCRVYPLRQPQNTPLPQLAWFTAGRTRFKALDGPVGITEARLQLDCRGHTLADADEVAAALRLPADSGGLDGFRGDMAGVFCQALLVEIDGDGDDDQAPPAHAEEAADALVTIRARLTFEEP